MASYPHLISQFAATTGIVAMLSTAAPVVAAERAVSSPEAATAPATTMPSVVKHRAPRGNRIAASHHDRRVSAIHGNLDCSDIWCGRQFVLMVGVGY
jgi:hypothetical protein